MRRTFLVIAAALALGAGLLSAEVTGKYKVTMEAPAGAQGGGGGGARGNWFANMQFDLKEAGGALTGEVHMGEGDRARSMPISSGKVADGKFSFETKFETPRGEMVMVYEGSVEGNTLKGTSKMKDSERPPRNFTATKGE
ncbi:MAG: hypothetical protein IT170_02810 [Bryobacterales bacterium]|nr:hypothetical protein [Bryobacterales bacterium]